MDWGVLEVRTSNLLNIAWETLADTEITVYGRPEQGALVDTDGDIAVRGRFLGNRWEISAVPPLLKGLRQAMPAEWHKIPVSVVEMAGKGEEKGKGYEKEKGKGKDKGHRKGKEKGKGKGKDKYRGKNAGT